MMSLTQNLQEIDVNASNKKFEVGCSIQAFCQVVLMILVLLQLYALQI